VNGDLAPVMVTALPGIATALKEEMKADGDETVTGDYKTNLHFLFRSF
jgi:hypothetical protein